MTLQAVASPIIVILSTLEVSFMFLETIYSSGVAYNCHLQILQAKSLNYTEKSFIRSVPEGEGSLDGVALPPFDDVLCRQFVQGGPV
jgi:hypothetical protein